MLRPSVLVLLLCLAAATVASAQVSKQQKILTVRALNDRPGPVRIRVEGQDENGTQILVDILTWDLDDNTFSDQILMIPDTTSVLRFTFINDIFLGPDDDQDRNAFIDFFTVDITRFEAEDFDRTGGTDPQFPGCGIRKVRDEPVIIVADCGNQNDWVEYDLDEVQGTVAMQDSLALVDLYNATDGLNWSNDRNWLTDSVATWFGVSVSAGRVTALNLFNNQLTGNIPTSLGNLSNLKDLDLRSNQLRDLPDLSSLNSLRILHVGNNRLTFEDIEPNIGVDSVIFLYSPQAKVDTARTITLNIGDSTMFSISVGGANNQYQWFKNDIPIPGAMNSTYTLTKATNADDKYVLKITNTLATELTLLSEPMRLVRLGESPYPVV